MMRMEQAGSMERVRLLLRESLTDIELVSYDLEKIVRNLRRKDSEYLEKISLLLENNDHDRAKAYAEEIAMLRKVAKLIYQSSLLVLTIKLRLETMVESEELYGMLPQLARLLSRISETNPLPNLEKEFAGVKTKLEEAASIITRSTDIKAETVDVEAERVIKEAERLASLKLETTFPKVPSYDLREEAKQKVLEYLKANTDSFNIEKCAKDLAMEKNDVENLLNELIKEKKVIVKREEELV
jgi:division protein CdvB (Snf7/Vps24/ESCRT-III family)